MLKKGHINIDYKDAALTDYEVIITKADGQKVFEIMNGYSYSGVFDKICEKYSDELSIAPESINIKHIGYSLA